MNVILGFGFSVDCDTRTEPTVISAMPIMIIFFMAVDFRLSTLECVRPSEQIRHFLLELLQV